MFEKVLFEILQNLQALDLQLYLAQVFSCEFYKISKNTFFTEHPWTTASECLVAISSGLSISLSTRALSKRIHNVYFFVHNDR